MSLPLWQLILVFVAPGPGSRWAGALAVVLAACSPPALADVISPEEELLPYRYFFSMAVDRVDQFCASEGINQPCHIPGSAFEGGGTGFCRRQVDEWLMKIDLTCTLRHPLVIDRQVPESAEYLPVPQLCTDIDDDKDTQYWLAHSNITCERPAQLPTDRFCRGKRRGDACQADGLQRGKRTVVAGRCTVEEETITYFRFGHGKATREFLACMPEKGVQVHHYQPVGFFKNLLLLL